METPSSLIASISVIRQPLDRTKLTYDLIANKHRGTVSYSISGHVHARLEPIDACNEKALQNEADLHHKPYNQGDVLSVRFMT
jgi:hypothetical protein